ncbi:GNAT family N-acetyltransferase [Pseudomonas sp. HMWF032]|jgi:GNAT superfamily N-acetyltransferase|uniref:GNAT family N-acetyltransferase n=1 Tax=Pseudomonas sp. HMWF032 TaxID=2056866 RepID=UPI000D3382E4|nr:GNAT family N-acetyltransferase [Pseudomonas sp. HMWF032]PTS84816.1 GNAT family N-acetyltransferase [Pseudomonas sp. HMWF032]PTT84412.1 GNAT family N-acetyltransferase [Pseudomonas sp. HMWF010]
MSIEIRPITPADHAAWLPLWQGYLHFYQSALPAEVSAMTWQRFLDPSEPTHAALAWRDGQAVGLVQWIFHRTNWSVEHSCYLQDLFVGSDQRGGGIGRLLIEHVYTQAQAAGCSRVHWLTQETNYPGRQLYDRIAERSGFIQYRKQF